MFVNLIAVLLLFSTSAADLDLRRKTLNDLIDEQWEYTLRTSPEFASILGDKRYNDQASDVSAAARKHDDVQNRAFLRRATAIGTAAFSDVEKVNHALFVRNLRDAIEDYEMKEWEIPISQMGGIHLFAAQLPAMLSFTTPKDHEDYIKRMRAFPKQIDDTIAAMRLGMRDKLMAPKFLLEKAGQQAAGLGALKAEDSPFALPLKDLKDEKLRARVLDAINTAVLPSYQKLAAFIRDEYAPAGRTHVGLWAVPNGAARYTVRARRETTTNLSPDRIHQIGLSEVARIEGEMLAIAKKLGFDDLKSFNAAMEKKKELRATSGEQILTAYRTYTEQMYAKLPQLFGRLPIAKMEVVPVEPFREKEAASASYEPPAPDGTRPGRVYVNTYDATSRKMIFTESTAYHEGVPGHHMQIAIAQELPALPAFRRFGGYNAFSEGWALYSETLGKEVGFYQDPYIDYGRLNDEMLRAIRLVVDTGLHSKKWTRQQVVDFFHDHSAIDEVEVQSETDRYIVMPGQALGYKIGSLKIAELRERARKKLGERFDIRGFHDQVLGGGSVPIDVLEQRIDAWIASH